MLDYIIERTNKYIASMPKKERKNMVNSLIVPYNLVVAGNDFYVYLVTDEKEVSVLEQLHKFNKTLPDIGLKMKTGLTVDFRNREILRDDEEEGAIQLFIHSILNREKYSFPFRKSMSM